MTKKEFIGVVAEKAGISKKDAEKALNATVDTITAALAAGDKVQVSGLGIFEAKERAARTGRNPLTKETIQIAASTVPAFKAAAALKNAVAKK